LEVETRVDLQITETAFLHNQSVHVVRFGALQLLKSTFAPALRPVGMAS